MVVAEIVEFVHEFGDALVAKVVGGGVCHLKDNRNSKQIVRPNISQASMYINKMDQNTDVKPIFTFIHFNDVYDIQPKEGSGKLGIVNFEAFIRKLRAKYPDALLLFSGDAFSPSILSNIYQGQQMVDCLNKLKIDAACMGNHQFDLDPEQTERLFKESNFPWLLGNMKYIETGELLGKGLTHYVKEVNGRNIGFYGVAGSDWIGILTDSYEDELEYEDVNEFSERISKKLREQYNCEMVVALTHMRQPQDEELPEKVQLVDLVLGGHDHIMTEKLINQIPVLKSGSNFKFLSLIQVYEKGAKKEVKYEGRRYDFDIELLEVPLETEDIDQQLKKYVDKCLEESKKFDKLIGYTDVDLDTRFSKVRALETNYANFLTDLIRNYFDADCCAVNSGCIRNDKRIKKGKITYSMISNLINDVLVVKMVPGSKIKQAMEYAVSSLPSSFAGSFLIVSGMTYSYDYRKTPKITEIKIQGEPIDDEREYKVAMKNYISGGGDGFAMFKDCKYLVDPTHGIDTLSLLLNFFKASDVTYDHEELKQMSAKRLSQKKEEGEEDELPPEIDIKMTKKKSSKGDRVAPLRKRFVLGQDGKKYVCISPAVDGRIFSIAAAELKTVEQEDDEVEEKPGYSQVEQEEGENVEQEEEKAEQEEEKAEQEEEKVEN